MRHRETPRRHGASSALIVVVVLALVGVACSADPESPAATSPTTTRTRPVAADTAATDGQLVIGAVLAQTGLLAPAESVVLASLQDAVEQLNASGAAGTPPIELRAIDTRSDLLTAAEITSDLIDRGADVIVVGCDLDLASTAARRARRANRVAVSPCAADTSFGPATAGELAFTLAPSLDFQADTLAERVIGVGARRVVVLSELEPFESGTACARATVRLRELGGDVAASLELDAATTAEEVAQIVADLGAIDAVVSCLGRDSVAPTLAALRAGAVSAPVFAIGGAAVAWPGEPVDNVTFLTLSALAAPSPAVDPAGGSAEALLGRATVQILAAATASLPDTYGTTVATALSSSTFATDAGQIGFGPDQRATGIGVVFMFTNGAEAVIAP